MEQLQRRAEEGYDSCVTHSDCDKTWYCSNEGECSCWYLWGADSDNHDCSSVSGQAIFLVVAFLLVSVVVVSLFFSCVTTLYRIFKRSRRNSAALVKARPVGRVIIATIFLIIWCTFVQQAYMLLFILGGLRAIEANTFALTDSVLTGLLDASMLCVVWLLAITWIDALNPTKSIRSFSKSKNYNRSKIMLFSCIPCYLIISFTLSTTHNIHGEKIFSLACTATTMIAAASGSTQLAKALFAGNQNDVTLPTSIHRVGKRIGTSLYFSFYGQSMILASTGYIEGSERLGIVGHIVLQCSYIALISYIFNYVRVYCRLSPSTTVVAVVDDSLIEKGSETPASNNAGGIRATRVISSPKAPRIGTRLSTVEKPRALSEKARRATALATPLPTPSSSNGKSGGFVRETRDDTAIVTELSVMEV